MFTRILTAAVLVLTTTLSAQATLLIDLDPLGGALSGSPGATVGWGYTVTNSFSNEYIVLTASDFSTASSLGTYTDYVPSNFVVIAPGGGQYSQAFNALSQTGTGSFLIDPLAPVGATATGTIVMSYDTYTGDPSIDVNAIYISSLTADTPASLTVADSSVPEPSTCILLTLGLCAVGFTRRERKRAEKRMATWGSKD